jgi:hypothetical protein
MVTTIMLTYFASSFHKFPRFICDLSSSHASFLVRRADING